MSSEQTSSESSIGTWLLSESDLYLKERIVGQGAFGTVAKCHRMSDMQTVAIKMMRDEGNLAFQAREEANNLLKLSVLDSNKCNLVKWHNAFTDRGYYCLEFENLDKSLYDLMVERDFQPLPLKEIRPIAQQLANALLHMKSVGMIHADLKVENVMLVNHAKEPFKLKVIDFGLACDTSDATVGSYIQTRPYRSPEIILGCPFTEAVDMWSVGCIIAYLYLGHLLYRGSSEYDMMRCIVDRQGQPPRELLDRGSKTSLFFEKVFDEHGYTWKLKDNVWGTYTWPVNCRAKKVKRLDEILTIRKQDCENRADKTAEIMDQIVFLDMLIGMLDLDPARRLTPQQVLNHPFVTMSHISGMPCLSSYFQSCAEVMTVCETSEFSKAKQSPPNSNNHQQCINPRPCKSAQPESTNMAQMKRKRRADAEDGEMSETSYPPKKAKLKHRNNNNCQESYTSKEPTNNGQSSSALKGHTDHRYCHFANPSLPQRCQIPTGIKRKFDSDKDQGHLDSSSDVSQVSLYRKRLKGSSNSSRVKQQHQRDVSGNRKMSAEEDNPESEFHKGSGPKRKRV